jgi:hypothetical protein
MRRVNKNVKVVKPITYTDLAFTRESEASYYDEDGILQFADNDELRYTYDPDTLEYLGPLFEAEATNYLAKSNDFLNAAWLQLGVSLDVTANSTTSPDGTTNATKFEGDQTLSGTTLRQSLTLSGPAIMRVFSVYVKSFSAATPTVRLSIKIGSSSIASVVYRILPGDYDALSSIGEIQPLPDGWFRCEIRTVVTGAVSLEITHVGAGLETVYIYGAQFENAPANNRATSYISNTGTGTATRAADVTGTPPTVVSTNIPEVDNPEYNPATAYDFEQEVMVVTGGYHRNYRSRVPGTDSNTGNFPPDSPDEWQDIGATNPWRMFDMTVGADLQSVGEDGIDVTVSLGHGVDSLFLFNVAGTSCKVTMVYNETTIYEVEKQLTAPPSEASWWHWLFDERTRLRNVAFFDLPPALPATVRVQIFGTGDVKLGKLVIGKSRPIGFAEYGATSIGIADYSVKAVDAFGNRSILERTYKDTWDGKVVVEPNSEIPLKDYLASLRATLCVYVVRIEPYPLLVLGYYNDFDVLFSTPASSYCSLQVEGI